ncbi:hypothetical protein BgiBS90_025510 [Biomphalaria glabrata]|nr:hypothetical protein BgiBS90_025510 [Biomphalaria glabrata]
MYVVVYSEGTGGLGYNVLGRILRRNRRFGLQCTWLYTQKEQEVWATMYLVVYSAGTGGWATMYLVVYSEGTGGLGYNVFGRILRRNRRFGLQCTWSYTQKEHEVWATMYLVVYSEGTGGLAYNVLGRILRRNRRLGYNVLGCILRRNRRFGLQCTWLYTQKEQEVWATMYVVVYSEGTGGLGYNVLGCILRRNRRFGLQCTWLYTQKEQEVWPTMYLVVYSEGTCRTFLKHLKKKHK